MKSKPYPNKGDKWNFSLSIHLLLRIMGSVISNARKDAKNMLTNAFHAPIARLITAYSFTSPRLTYPCFAIINRNKNINTPMELRI